MTTLHPHALLLDMDGTLVDSNAVVERVMSDWARSHGLDVDRVLALSHGRQAHEVMAELLPERPAAQNHAENRELLAREVADTDGVVAIPGAAAFLQSIADLPHALVTSATLELAQARMRAAGLRVPAVAVTADDVVESKPRPEGFLRAAELLCVVPADCVVFEDSRAGVAAGKAAGAAVVGVGAAARQYGADHVVVDLTAVSVDPETLSIHLNEG